MPDSFIDLMPNRYHVSSPSPNLFSSTQRVGVYSTDIFSKVALWNKNYILMEHQGRSDLTDIIFDVLLFPSNTKSSISSRLILTWLFRYSKHLSGDLRCGYLPADLPGQPYHPLYKLHITISKLSPFIIDIVLHANSNMST